MSARITRCVLVALTLLVTTWQVAVAQTQIIPPWHAELPAEPQRATMTVGEVEVEVELALASRQQNLGLGYRNGLEPGAGMLFVFEDQAEKSFWMGGMRFCLDIIWIGDGEIVGAAESVCPELASLPTSEWPSYVSPEPVAWVLEMPAGWLEAQGFGPGTPVELPEELLTDLGSG